MISTYSIVGCDLEAREWGVAVQSKFLAVGAAVPAAAPEVGAIATQAWANLAYRPRGLELLEEGRSADEVVRALVAADDGRSHRQVGVVDAHGRAATYTGSDCLDWAGGTTGAGYAALLVVRKDGGYGGTSDVAVDLRVDDHPGPIEELERIYRIHDLLFGQTPDEEWLDVGEELAEEMRGRLAALGYEGDLAGALAAWAGAENLEERVRGADRIDPVVLEQLRAR